MQTIQLGKTGLKPSVAGLGSGGPSRLGKGIGRKPADAHRVVERALELGINLIDTAPAYGNEKIIGRALKKRRQSVILCTKVQASRKGEPVSAAAARTALEESLKNLRTDYLDIYQLHGIAPDRYDYAVDELLPVMKKAREEGKVRFIGITEQFVADPSHIMLERALADGYWDTVMVGYNMLNQTARRRVLPEAEKEGIGVLGMFAVRRALSRPEKLRSIIQELLDDGKLREGDIDANDPLGFVLKESDASGLAEAAYRYVRHQPGMGVVLTGTGNPDHLEENVRAIEKGPLPDGVIKKLDALFGQFDFLTGN